ncbi:MAG: PA2778 family cysteine peptidase [Acidiferrobacterales bacterium]
MPFFPQEAYQCGPAALATILASAGTAVTPAALAPQVFLPARRGSLQLELMAAARRHGHVPYVLEPRLVHMLQEVQAGNPVLVLQNLALSWNPYWHYAVVIGFDLPARQVILRSGRLERHVMALAVFERTWRRGAYWAMVSPPPGTLPATADERRYVEALSAFERVGSARAAAESYTLALERWPDSFVAWIGLGNSRYQRGDLRGAEAAYREAIRQHPDQGAAYNNLAHVLAEQSRLGEAEEAARLAVRLGGALRASAEETLQAILGARHGAERR